MRDDNQAWALLNPPPAAPTESGHYGIYHPPNGRTQLLATSQGSSLLLEPWITVLPRIILAVLEKPANWERVVSVPADTRLENSAGGTSHTGDPESQLKRHLGLKVVFRHEMLQ